MTLLGGRGGGGREAKISPRPYSIVSFPFRLFFPFFLFSFFIRIFRFEDSKRGCKRATRDSEQRYSTSQDRADQPDLEGGYRLITKRGYLYASVSFHPYLNFYLRPFELTVTDFISRGIFVTANEREMAPLEEIIDAPSNVF